MPKRKSFWNGSRTPGGVNTASPASPLSNPDRSRRESRPESRQSASPARPVSGRSSEAMKRQSDSAAASSIASSVSGKKERSIQLFFGVASGRSMWATRSSTPLTNADDSSDPNFFPSSMASLSVTRTGTSARRKIS